MSIVKPLSEMRSTSNGGKIYGLYKLLAMGLPVPKTFGLAPQDYLNLTRSDLEYIQLLFPKGTRLAIRSSAIGEDGGKNSFAGIFESVLNVDSSNISSLADAIQQVGNSVKKQKVESYNKSNPAKMGIIIQEMIQPVFSGVAFTDSLTPDGKNAVLIEFVQGLGDKLVSGKANAEKIFIPYNIHGDLDMKDMQYVNGEYKETDIIEFLPELLQHLKTIKEKFNKPMDTEWAMDSNGKTWMLQARPITKQVFVPKQNSSADVGIVASYGKNIVAGETYFVSGYLEEGPELDAAIQQMPNGAVLILTYSDTYYLPAMRKASAIISTNGSILAHAAIVSRELGIPCIVGVKNADTLFPNGTKVRIDTSKCRIETPNKVFQGTQLDMDWGELNIYANIHEVKFNMRDTVLFEVLPDGQIAAYLPDKPLTDSMREKIEIYSRTKYHKSPQIYQTEKFLWFFENKRFQNIAEFNTAILTGERMAKSVNISEAVKYFDYIYSTIANLKQRSNITTDQFTKFLLEETIEAVHFAGMIRIAQGTVIANIYNNIKTILKSYNMNFIDFVSLEENAPILKQNPILKQHFDFMKKIEVIRNNMFQRLLVNELMRPDYFQDRSKRVKKALNITERQKPGTNLVDLFYNRLTVLNNLKKIVYHYLNLMDLP